MAEFTVTQNSKQHGFIQLITSTNIPIILLVDSGSDVSIITKHVVDKCSSLVVEHSNITFVEGISGSIRPLGETSVTFNEYGSKMTLRFLVINNFPIADGLLGRDFLNQYGAIINYEEGTLRVNSLKIPLFPTKVTSFCVKVDRTQVVLQHLTKAITQSPIEAQTPLRELVEEYSDIFRLSSEEIPPVNFYKQRIVLSDKKPVYIPQYRIPHSHRQEMKRQVTELVKMGIIRPSSSNYNNPCLLVPKKTGDWRFVTDFRQLNRKIIPDKYPLPHFDDIFDGLGKTDPQDQNPRFFSTFDLTKGFYQIPLEEDSCKYTAFNVGFGFFEYTRLPFGISVAPNGFSRMIATAFQHMIGKNAFVFIDDLIIKSHTVDEHLKEIKKAFETCRVRSLSLNPAKVKFFKNSVTYLGHEMNEWGIYPDRTKFEVIAKWPRPETKDDAKRFVSFASYYRRFVKNFAQIASPINNLTKKRIDFKWDSDCEEAFKKLKYAVSHPPILIFPDFMRLFIIVCDASKDALGAVLGHDVDNLFRPIHYASQALNKSEKGKSTIEKELLAIYWAIIRFKPYIYGRHFLIRSDHKPLIYLFGLKDPTGKLNRMRLEFEEHSFTIEYIKGKDNVLADGLSRINIEDLTKLKALVVAVCSVTTRLQAQKETQNSQKVNPPVLELSKECPPKPLKINRVINNNNEKNGSNNIKEFKFLEANHFSSRRYPEMMFDLGASRIIVGYSLRLRNPKRLLIINYKNINEDRYAKTKKTKIDKESMLRAQITLAFKILNKEGLNSNMKNVRLNKMDPIFKIFSKAELAKCANELTNINIFLFEAPEKINKEDKTKIENILKAYHDDPLGGHSGYSRLISKIKMKYEWKGMTKDVIQHIKNCVKCQLNKPSRKTKEELCITETPTKTNELISIDTVGPLAESDQGYKYILTIQCNLSKHVVAIPMRSKTANSIAEAFFEGFIYIFGFPKVVISDMGSEYVNAILEELMKICQIEHKTSAGYRPQTIGGLERNHRVLNEYLRHYLNQNQNNWPNLIRSYQFAYNTTPNPAINNYTPYELVFGKIATLPDYVSDTKITPVYDIENYAKQLKYQLQTTQIQARTYLEMDKQKRKMEYDKNAKPSNIEVGNEVKLINEQRNKFDARYLGPFKVVNINKPNAYIKKPGGNKIKKVHMDRLIKIQ